MTSDFPVPTTVSYATVEEVCQELQRPPPSDSADDGGLQRGSITRAILAWEEQIDKWCGQSWRERRVTDEYPIDGLGNLQDWEGFVSFGLRHTDVRTLSVASGDKLEVWNGSQFEDYVASRTQGRQGDYYMVPEQGIVKIRSRVIFGDARDRVRVTYRYGQTQVPYNVRRACAILVAASLVVGSTSSQAGQGSGVDFVPSDSRSRKWSAEAQALLAPYQTLGGL